MNDWTRESLHPDYAQSLRVDAVLHDHCCTDDW